MTMRIDGRIRLEWHRGVARITFTATKSATHATLLHGERLDLRDVPVTLEIRDDELDHPMEPGTT